jgi:hypothetical protein
MILKIFENEFLICELDDSLPVLKHTWKKEATGLEFKSNLMKVLQEYNILKTSYAKLAWLADTTLLGELDEETEEWLGEVWEDLLFKQSGVKIHAVILGNNIFADYPMEQFKKHAEEKFEELDVRLGVFSNEKNAYRWVHEQQVLIREHQ